MSEGHGSGHAAGGTGKPEGYEVRPADPEMIELIDEWLETPPPEDEEQEAES